MRLTTDNPAVLSRQAPIRRLKEFLGSLAEGLRKQGVSPGELADKLSSGVKVSCLECGLTLTPNELSALVEGAEIKSPKLERIALGYCGRNACRSSFYAVTLLAMDDYALRQAWGENERDLSSGIVMEETATAIKPSLWEILVQQYGRKKLAIAIGLILVAGFMIYWRLRTPSWASNPSPRYKPDVSRSVGDSPFRPDNR